MFCGVEMSGFFDQLSWMRGGSELDQLFRNCKQSNVNGMSRSSAGRLRNLCTQQVRETARTKAHYVRTRNSERPDHGRDSPAPIVWGKGARHQSDQCSFRNRPTLREFSAASRPLLRGCLSIFRTNRWSSCDYMDEGLRVVASNHDYMESMRRIHCPTSSMRVQTGGSADHLLRDIIATNFGQAKSAVISMHSTRNYNHTSTILVVIQNANNARGLPTPRSAAT
jgi:hypothetical protein